ncbi:MAG: MbnP family protein [Bacteroidota bacterium]|nr:MbnP family protein [Bacteroidota bacterium]
MKLFFIYSGLIVFAFSCKKNPIVIEPNPKFTISLNHVVETSHLSLYKDWYTNQAGNKYRVRHLRYFISNIVLKRNTGNNVFLPVHWLVDVESELSTVRTWLQNVEGNYNGISFFIGVDSASNVTDALGSNLEVQNMAWPDMMGGGYHFLQFEGDYVSKDTVGFAMHLGRNSQLVKIDINKDFSVLKNGTNLKLTMDLSEWFKNPYTYNFDTDGNYIMGIDSLMQKISKNGNDVFQIH